MSMMSIEQRRAYFRKYYRRKRKRILEYRRGWNKLQRSKMVNDPDYAEHVRAVRLKAFRKWYKKNASTHYKRNRATQLKHIEEQKQRDNRDNGDGEGGKGDTASTR